MRILRAPQMAALSHLRNKKESKLRDGIDKVWSVDSSLWQIGHFILDHGQVWGWDSGQCKRRELSWRHAHIQYCPGQKGNIQDQQGRASYHYCFHLMSGPGHFFWAQNSFQFNNFDLVSSTLPDIWFLLSVLLIDFLEKRRTMSCKCFRPWDYDDVTHDPIKWFIDHGRGWLHQQRGLHRARKEVSGSQGVEW